MEINFDDNFLENKEFEDCSGLLFKCIISLW